MKYGLLACFLFTSWAVLSQQKAKKNVLFIIVDDLKPLLGCYGDTNARTPNIDRLAARGRVFDRAYCQEAVCAPSRASFMTGKRPDQLKIWGHAQPFRPIHPDIITLPQYFKNNGYTTAAAGKIYHDPPAHHDAASWSWPALLGETTNGPGNKYVLEENAGKSKAAAVERAAVDDTGYIDGKVAVAAIDLLTRLKDQPFSWQWAFVVPTCLLPRRNDTGKCLMINNCRCRILRSPQMHQLLPSTSHRSCGVIPISPTKAPFPTIK